PTHTRVSRAWERSQVEVELRVAGRDHFGRLADTARLVVDPANGAEGRALNLSQAAAAHAAPLTPADHETVKSVLGYSEEILRPQLEAAAGFLRLRSAAEYRQRVERAQGVAERARRERPDEARQTEQALKRETASLAAVFAVEVECAIVAAWVI